MKINIISNINNGAGLQKDFELLRDLLVEMGHEVNGIPFREACNTTADVNIFLEVVVERHLHMARRNFLIPNPEWYFPQWDTLLPHFSAVLCKTRACYELFRNKVPESALHFTGFFSRDMFEPTIPRERKFLHVAGLSQTKNTLPIISAWAHYKLPYPLTIVSQHYMNQIPNVSFLRRVNDEYLKVLMNSHKFHLMPSMYEGFGHAIHEAFGCEAVVITTNAAPMNEWCVPSKLLCEPSGLQQHHLGTLHHVSKEQIEETTRNAWALDGTTNHVGEHSRKFFLQEREEFAERFKALL